MSKDDAPHEPPAPASRPVPDAAPVSAPTPVPAPAPREPLGGKPRDPRPADRPPAPRRMGGAAAALTVLLALIALAGAGYAVWLQREGGQSAVRATRALQSRVDTLTQSVSQQADQRAALTAQLGDANTAAQGLRGQMQSEDARLRQLENAVAQLSEQSRSGHDATLLDEAESLLRMGAQRYTLFNNARDAAAAYGLAEQALAGVRDDAFAGVRQSIANERTALLQSEAGQPQTAMSQLDQLRASVGEWALKSSDQPAAANAKTDVWSRIGHALSSVVKIDRDDGTPLAMADTRLTRQLLALDLVQAQAALLAHDSDAYQAALQRVQAGLDAFDAQASDVRAARATVSGLVSHSAIKPAVALGTALGELRNLRAVHALQPATPASSASAPGSQPAPPAVNQPPAATSTAAPASSRSAGATP